MSQTKFDERDCFEGHFWKKKKLFLFLTVDQPYTVHIIVANTFKGASLNQQDK